MGNRSHKRSETVDDMPADKRACSEVRPSSSNSSVQAPTHSNSEPHNADMDTSSSASWSNRSDGEAERDYSGYGTCDSDGDQRRSSLREYYHRQRSMSDYGKFKRVLSSLEQEIGESEILVSLSELCELLSFCGDSSLAGSVADLMSPILVKLSRHETNADIMLLSVRAITYLCDANPRSSALLVRHDAVVALCQRLMAIEYLDVAEQCLQALEKISLEQPLVCLQSGVVMAVLTYIDFFSTSVQRVALSTVVNICQKLPSDFSSFFTDAVPILCNLLQYEDRQLVEHVATCLIKIAERVHQSPDMLNQLCKHELIQQTVHLISLNCRTTLSRPVQSGLVGLLVKLASGSILAVQNLFELQISSILKDVLSTHGLSHGTVSPYIGDGHMDQVHEVLKLLNELLPSVAIDKVIPLNYEKEALLKNKPSHLLKFGTDLLSVLIQVVNSGANMYVCYGCLSVIKSIVYFSSSEILIEVLTDTDISSFLAGVFSRKDQHVMMLGLQITDTVLQKLSDVFLSSFIKEGVFFTIDTLLKSENCKEIAFSTVSDIQPSDDTHQKSAARSSIKCLCYSFDAGPPANDSERICKLEKDSLYNLAKKIRSNYFPAEILNHEQGVTDVLQKLRCLADTLTQCVNISLCKDSPRQQDEICLILYQIMSQLNGEECVSTFELLESGIVKALLKYLCNNRQYPEEKSEATYGSNRMYDEEKRVNVFGRVLLSSQDAPAEDFVLLTRKLQTSLSSIESFPVIQSHLDKQRAGYATVPLRRCLSYPSLRIHFVRAEGEACLSEYSEGIVAVDSFSTLDAIERYLWPKVGKNRSEHEPTEAIQKSGSPKVDSDNNSDMKQDNAVDRSHSSSEDNSMNIDYSRFSDEDTTPKLLFFLDGHLIDPNSSLYQAVIQQQNNAAHETDNSGKLWSQLYKITYRKAVGPSKSYPPYCPNQDHDSSNDSISRHWCCSPFSPDRFISTFSSELRSSIAVYDVLLLLKILEGMNRFSFHLMSREKLYAFAEGKFADLDKLKAMLYTLPQNEFVSKKLTEKLEQQLRDPLSVSVGGMPSWCGRLMASCPFLFSFEVRCKYFGLTAFGKSRVQQHMASHDDSGGVRERRQSGGLLPRKKFLVCRDQILESAAKMMELHARQKVILEVEYNEEVGTGLGPTLEFFTLVGHEFQKNGLGMWREDHILLPNIGFLCEDTQMIGPSCQLFPRPWSSSMTISNGIEFSEVVKKFSLLGQITARVLQDGRVLDIPFSRAFYKLILGQELTAYDIHSFDPELGKTLLEFQAIIERKKHLKSVSGGTPVMEVDSCFRNTTIEDLCLDFTLPGYPDYVLSSGSNPKLVNMANLDEYVSLIVDATISSGISRQVEAFKSGFNQVFPIKHLEIFNEEELERLLCGECEFWSSNELLDHIKFDHGYTASSPPILNLLEIIQEFDREHQRAFLQFVTGAPRLPRGGLASLNPKLTIVRKHCNWNSDDDLPSVMTCANYLKLPPYSSKEMMKKKLMYAITEGQGSFHLS